MLRSGLGVPSPIKSLGQRPAHSAQVICDCHHLESLVKSSGSEGRIGVDPGHHAESLAGVHDSYQRLVEFRLTVVVAWPQPQSHGLGRMARHR